MRRALVIGLLGLAFSACKFDPAYRDITEPGPPPCEEGKLGCRGNEITRCENGASRVLEDCAARSLVCAPTLGQCTPCVPSAVTCDGPHVLRCSAE